MSQARVGSKARTLLPLTVRGVVLEVDQVDLHGVVGEEDVTLTGDLHQRHSLTGEGLLEELPHAA